MSPDDRTANLLGAFALTLADRAAGAIHDTGVGGSDAAALITLRNYAEGEPLDLLRRALALSHPAVVRLADRLEQRGLAVRQRAAHDGRAVGLTLTAAGRRAADAALSARGDAVGAALDTLGEDERGALAMMLERMLAAATTDSTASLVICRLCDPEACGHPGCCPVTQAAQATAAAERGSSPARKAANSSPCTGPEKK